MRIVTMIVRRSLGSLVVSAVLCLGGYSSAWAQPASYTFSADPETVIGNDQALVTALTGLAPAGTFTYDNSVAQTGTAPERSSHTGAATYFGGLTNLVGSVNGMQFSDPIGRIRVGDDRYEPTGLTDIVFLHADPRSQVNFVGFEVGGYTLTNVRMVWIEGLNGIGDFLSSEDLPRVLPRFEGTIAFDFVLTTDSNVLANVFFGALEVIQETAITGPARPKDVRLAWPAAENAAGRDPRA